MRRRAGWVVAALATASCAYPDFPAREDAAADSTVDAGDSTVLDSAIVDGRSDTADTTAADASDSSAPDSGGDSTRVDSTADTAAPDSATEGDADDGALDAAADACSEAGACSPGATRSVACGMCGTEVDTCSAGCSWSAGACGGEGVCAPGSIGTWSTSCVGVQVHSRLCRPDCTWGDYSSCDFPIGWTPISSASGIGLQGRSYPAAAWTGGEMLVAGGDLDSSSASSPLDNGGLYNPLTDRWRSIATAPFKFDSLSQGVAWTGDRLVVIALPEAASYSPTADAWTAITSPPLTGRNSINAVWSPATNEVIAWGGQSGPTMMADGAAFKPSTGVWRKIAAAPIAGRVFAAKVAAGGRIFFFGGICATAPASVPCSDGGIYDPVADSWTVASSTSHSVDWGWVVGVDVLAPTERAAFSNGTDGFLDDPVTNLSVAMKPLSAGLALSNALLPWSSDKLFCAWDPNLRQGGCYDNASTAWSALPALGSPSARAVPAAVFTGRTFIVWSGLLDTATDVEDGFVLRPL